MVTVLQVRATSVTPSWLVTWPWATTMHYQLTEATSLLETRLAKSHLWFLDYCQLLASEFRSHSLHCCCFSIIYSTTIKSQTLVSGPFSLKYDLTFKSSVTIVITDALIVKTKAFHVEPSRIFHYAFFYLFYFEPNMLLNNNGQ